MKLTKKQEYELLASISGRGEIPTKYLYLNSGVKNWENVYEQRVLESGTPDIEMNLISSHIDSFASPYKKFKGLNVIDLGCGNGLPAVSIIRQLLDRDLDVMYVAVDLSLPMIELAIKNVKKVFKELKTQELLIDFEKESLTDSLLNFKQRQGYPNFMINLGNTIGNYVNVGGVISNFLESMALDDYLLVGNGVANDYNPQKILMSYDTGVVRDFALSSVRSLRIFKEVDELKWIWNENKGRVEGRLKLNHDATITLAGQNITLARGEELLIAQSRKYSETTFTKLFSDSGFRIELLTTNVDRSHVLALVQPTRYGV